MEICLGKKLLVVFQVLLLFFILPLPLLLFVSQHLPTVDSEKKKTFSNRVSFFFPLSLKNNYHGWYENLYIFTIKYDLWVDLGIDLSIGIEIPF